MPFDTFRKKEGFQGQKAVIIPRNILSKQCQENEVINNLHITDIGYYPKAKFHYRERPAGAGQHILIYGHEGEGSVQIKKNKYNIKAGDFFVVPMKTAHTYAADETDPWTIYWAHFKGSISDSVVSLMQKKAGGHKGFIKSSESGIKLFNSIYHELERGYSSDNLIYANLCFWQYLTTFIYNTKSDISPKLISKDSSDIAIDYMSKNIDQTLSLEDIAGEVNLSPAHFSSIFKKKTGFSPIEYFNHLKVQMACQFLLFTQRRIKEIALELGIQDQYYFSRMFTKVMGMSPNVYREKRIQ